MINIKMLIRNLLVMTLLLFVIVSTSYAQFRKLNLLATTPLTLDPNTRFQKTVPCRKLDVTLVEIEKRLLKEGKKLTTARNKKEMQAYQKLEKRYLKLVKLKKKLNSKRLSSCETKTSRSTREAFRDLTRLLNSQLEQRDVRAQIHSYPFISEISQTQNEKSILILNEGDSPIFIKDWLREIDEQQEKIVELARGGFERMRTERTELAQVKTPNPLQESALGMDDLGESGNLDDLGLMFREHWEMKKKLSSGVTNNQIDSIYNTALDNGAVGGKISGAGGGGFLNVFATKNDHEKIIIELSKKGLIPFNFKHDGNGTIVMEYK